MKIQAKVINAFCNNVGKELGKTGAALLNRKIKPSVYQGVSTETASSVAFYFNLLGEDTSGAVKFDFSDDLMRYIRTEVCEINEQELVLEDGEYEAEDVENFLLELSANIFELAKAELEDTPDRIEQDMPKILNGAQSLNFGDDRITLLTPIGSTKGIIFLKFIFEK